MSLTIRPPVGYDGVAEDRGMRGALMLAQSRLPRTTAIFSGIAVLGPGLSLLEAGTVRDYDEQWRLIPGWPDYEVSDQGRIRSWKVSPPHGDPPRILKQMIGPYGYRYIFLYRAGKMKQKRVHRAVLEAFVGPCPEGLETRHLDGDRKNNHRRNLAWGDRYAQIADRRRHNTLLCGEASPTHKLKVADVRQIRRLLPGTTCRKLAARYGVSHTTILAAANGHHWSDIGGV